MVPFLCRQVKIRIYITFPLLVERVLGCAPKVRHFSKTKRTLYDTCPIGDGCIDVWGHQCIGRGPAPNTLDRTRPCHASPEGIFGSSVPVSTLDSHIHVYIRTTSKRRESTSFCRPAQKCCALRPSSEITSRDEGFPIVRHRASFLCVWHSSFGTVYHLFVFLVRFTFSLFGTDRFLPMMNRVSKYSRLLQK